MCRPFKDQGVEGWKEGGGRRGGGVSSTRWGSILHIIGIQSFLSRRKEMELGEFFFFFFTLSSLALLICGFVRKPLEDLYA